MSNKLDTTPYKGVRDFYPEEMHIERYIFDTMSQTAESFGYAEYSASILEPAELYRQKSSDEIVNEQTYTFTDRGYREVTLRPEMTPTVARMIAGKRHDLSFPLRWYSIANVFRYERPQRGRTREHFQLNVDLFGVSENDAEVEMLLLASNLMKAFGATEQDFEIRISDRGILAAIAETLGISDELRLSLARLLDKKDKIENFNEKLEELLGEQTDAFTELLSRATSNTTLEAIVKKAGALGVTNTVIDPSVVRGFDYYTGVVFEVFDTSPENNRSLFGGGRYDNLLELFGGEPIPAIGFGMGDVTIRDFLETHDLLPTHTPNTDLFLCTLTEESSTFAQQLAEELRAKDIRVEVALSHKKIGDQIKLADKKKIPFVICIGEDEIKNDTFTIKHLESGESETLKEAAIVDYIFSKV